MRMRLVIAGLIFGLSLSPGAGLRPCSAQTLSAGATAGLNLATFAGRDRALGTFDPERRRGFDAGAVLRVTGRNMLRLQQEVHFTRKGALFRQEFLEVPVTTRFDLSYAESALILGVQPPFVQDGFTPWIGVGLAGAILVDCEIAVESGPFVAVHACSEPELDLRLRSVDYCVVAAGGADVEARIGWLSFEMRVCRGLASIHRSAAGEERINRNLSFRIGYVLPLGR